MHDLVAAAPFAELRSTLVSIRPGSLDSELLEERGFERAAGLGTEDPSSLLRSPATLLVPLGTPAPGRMVVDVAPEPGFEGQELEVADLLGVSASDRGFRGRSLLPALFADTPPLLTAVYRQMLGGWLADVRREVRLEARPAQIDERDAESLRALGYLR